MVHLLGKKALEKGASEATKSDSRVEHKLKGGDYDGSGMFVVLFIPGIESVVDHRNRHSTTHHARPPHNYGVLNCERLFAIPVVQPSHPTHKSHHAGQYIRL